MNKEIKIEKKLNSLNSNKEDGRLEKQVQKAIEEIVELIEEMKEHLDTEERQEIFGRNGFASELQSPMTRKIVSQIKIKNNFKNLGKTKKKTNDS